MTFDNANAGLPKIIWIISQYDSTPETSMGGRHYYLTRELEALGYQVYMVAASQTHLLRQPPLLNKPFLLERREGINIVWIKTPRYGQAHSKKRIWNWFLFSFRLLKLDRVIPKKPDVILYSSPSLIGYLGAERLARRLGARLVFEVRDIWPLTLCDIGGYSVKHPFIRFLQWIENRAYRNADMVISNLKNAHDHMVLHGLGRGKFYWIPNGISVREVGEPQALDDKIIQQLPRDGFVVGYTGTLGVANCLETLIEAAVLLKDRKDIKFVIVGKGRNRASLQELAEKYRLDNVAFVDAIPKSQVQTILQRFDALFIGLSKSSLFRYGVSPNKLFDYLYAAKPILYAIESGNYHPVADAEAGVELPAEDPDALADAISALYGLSPEQRDKMGQNGRRAVLDQYEYGALARKLEKALCALGAMSKRVENGL